jgi:hypothetical protein
VLVMIYSFERDLHSSIIIYHYFFYVSPINLNYNVQKATFKYYHLQFICGGHTKQFGYLRSRRHSSYVHIVALHSSVFDQRRWLLNACDYNGYSKSMPQNIHRVA